MPNQQRRPFSSLPPAQQAGILCNDERFKSFAGTRTIKSGVILSDTATAEYIRMYCKVTSRRDLNRSVDAARKFQTLCTEFDAWTGKIATPR
jgi:hypothetical protein